MRVVGDERLLGQIEAVHAANHDVHDYGRHAGCLQSRAARASIGGVQGSAWTELPSVRGGVVLGALCLEVVFGRIRSVLVGVGMP